MNIVFFVTIAHNIQDTSLHVIREHEYMYCLSRIFSYNLPVYGVISESMNYPVVTFFPFKKTLYIESTAALNAHSKSQKEYTSLKKLLSETTFDDDTWIIKMSGRYMLVDDSFVDKVKNSNKKAVLKKCDDSQMYTFLYAIRYGVYKKLFDKHLPENINIEYHILNELLNHINEDEIEFMDKLGILSNINNQHNFMYF
jgi:hypothetical protein